MLKRTLFFGNSYHVHTENQQLKAACKTSGEVKSIPIEDVGFIVFEHPQITFTQSVMQLLAANNTAVVFCDEKYHPSSMLLHLDTHQVQTERFRAQVNASEPLKKQLWQQTIKAKINNQATALHITKKEGEDALRYLSKQVLSGDSTNQEAQAARRYWSKLLGKDFTRERYGKGPNSALNYGYAILRAATARALSGGGLLPTLGIHHRNKYNSYCLADDVMEPYRPFVDVLIIEMLNNNMNVEVLGREEKATLLQLLTLDVQVNGKKSPLMVALSATTASLSKCYEGKAKKIIYPELNG